MKPYIKQCDWEITTDCNLNCKHCLINPTKKELSANECFFVIDTLKRLGCTQINFTGGEALTKKDFLDILKYSNKKRFISNLFTNGTGISKQNISLLKKYVSYIGVSLEGLKKENDFIRGKNSYLKTINSLRLLSKSKIPFGIYLTLNKHNIDNLKKILKKIKTFNPSNISLNELVLRGRARKNKKELYIDIKREKILKILEDIFPSERFRIEKGCTINPKKIFLTSEGKIYLCTEIRQLQKNQPIGSLMPIKLNNFVSFSKKFSNKKRPKYCPYLSYVSKKITANFLTNEKCPHIKR